MIRFLWKHADSLTIPLLVFTLALGVAGCGNPTPPPEDPSAWYVSPQGSDTLNTCHSYQSPCQTINAVLSQASSGQVIYIAAGTYYEWLHLYDLGVDLEGSGPGTIISGSNLRPVDGGVIDSICTASSTSGCTDTLTIANLTIQNGFAEENGGGVYVWYTPLVMRNVIVSNNTASSGGGIYIHGSTATLDHVIVTGNKAVPLYDSYGGEGGGIYNYGLLTVSDSTIFANTASEASGYDGAGGGFYNAGWAGLTNVVITGNSVPGAEGNGGGIMNKSINSPTALLSLTDSTLRDNQATHGGGLSNDLSEVLITGSTIYNNTSTTAGGGILNTNSARLTLINSTISGNNGGNEGGGIVSNQGSTLNMTNDTIADNQATHTGGLIYESGSIYLLNVLLDGNSGGNCGSMVIGGSYNISSDASCSFCGEFNNNGVTTKLGPLQDNGGPTETHALLSGSPAIDAGSALLAPNVDQRGLPRPHDGNNDGVSDIDIGAFEFGFISAEGIKPYALVTATPGLGDFTFEEAWTCLSGPGPEYAVLAQGAAGETAPVDGRTPDGAFYHVKLQREILCWVSGNLGTFDGNPFGLPPLPYPPTPTATPTRRWIPSPTWTQPPVVCSNFGNKAECESHPECIWTPPGMVPSVCRNK
jgi:hypothetical protein